MGSSKGETRRCQETVLHALCLEPMALVRVCGPCSHDRRASGLGGLTSGVGPCPEADLGCPGESPECMSWLDNDDWRDLGSWCYSLTRHASWRQSETFAPSGQSMLSSDVPDLSPDVPCCESIHEPVSQASINSGADRIDAPSPTSADGIPHSQPQTRCARPTGRTEREQ